MSYDNVHDALKALLEKYANERAIEELQKLPTLIARIKDQENTPEYLVVDAREITKAIARLKEDNQPNDYVMNLTSLEQSNGLTATDVAIAKENYNLLLHGYKRSIDLNDREHAAVNFLYPDLTEAYANQRVREALDKIDNASSHTQPSLHDVIESIRKELNQPNS